MASIIPNSQFSKIFNPQDDSNPMAQQTKISFPMSINQNPVMRNPRMPLEPTQPNQLSLSPMSQPTPEAQDDDSGRFLASLIAQGAAGFGTGMMGGSPKDIMNSANMFQYMRDTQENQRRAKLLTDPNSEESKRKREVYKSLGFQVPNNFSATDLNDPTVLQTLKGQMEQSRLAAMPRQGGGVRGSGVGQEKPEKEVKSNEKRLTDYRDLAESLQNSINVIDAVTKLNRFRGGGILPTLNIDKRVLESTIDQNAQPLVKQLAGPGAVTESERETFLKLVPNANMPVSEALQLTKTMAKNSVLKTLEELNFDLQTGQINKKDYDTIVSRYNKYLSNPKLGLNQQINQQGELVDLVRFGEE
jgi:hypothetical protein